MKKSNKRYKVSLTRKQWDLVTCAMHEYSCVCDQDSDMPDGSNSKNLYELAKELEKVGTNIGVQILRQVENEKK